jgi:hypothetical protein
MICRWQAEIKTAKPTLGGNVRIVDQAFMRWIGISFLLLLTSGMGLAQGLPEQRELAGQQPSAEPQSGQAQPDKVKQEKTPPSTPEENTTVKDESAQLPSGPVPKVSDAANATPSGAVQETQGQQSPPQQQDSTRKPIGAAAAENEKASGIAASNPAGVAIAPAKQRRSRGFFIKVGAALGAGVAVGTAMALSRSSPSRPPGSH